MRCEGVGGMRYIFAIMIMLSVVFGILGGNIDLVSNKALSEASEAVELVLYLCGGMCLWCGVMQVARASGLTKKLAYLLSPIVRWLFPSADIETREIISLNITSNMLGLGNAATPLGISAMTGLARSAKGGTATPDMIMLVVINTASLQLIPTTVATLRLKYGCSTPLDILPAVLISSVVALAVGIIVVRFGNWYIAKRRGV